VRSPTLYRTTSACLLFGRVAQAGRRRIDLPHHGGSNRPHGYEIAAVRGVRFGHHASSTSVDGVELAGDLGQPLSQRSDVVFQLENPFDTGEIDALLLRQ